MTSVLPDATKAPSECDYGKLHDCSPTGKISGSESFTNWLVGNKGREGKRWRGTSPCALHPCPLLSLYPLTLMPFCLLPSHPCPPGLAPLCPSTLLPSCPCTLSPSHLSLLHPSTLAVDMYKAVCRHVQGCLQMCPRLSTDMSKAVHGCVKGCLWMHPRLSADMSKAGYGHTKTVHGHSKTVLGCAQGPYFLSPFCPCTLLSLDPHLCALPSLHLPPFCPCTLPPFHPYTLSSSCSCTSHPSALSPFHP